MAYESREYSSSHDADALRRNSMSGESGRRTGEKKIKMTLSAYKMRLKILAVAVAAATSVAFSCVPGAIKTVSDNWTVNKLMNEFHITYVTPETHRTDDNEHFFYDYDDIAAHLEEYGDFDEAVYLLNRDIGYYQTGQVLRWTPYESFTNYLEEKGYTDEEEFQDDMKKQIIMGIELQEMREELHQMQAAHTSEYDSSTYGGK